MTSRPCTATGPTIAPIRVHATLELGALAPDRLVAPIIGHASHGEHVVVPHDDAAWGNRAHRQLLMMGDADLAYDERVERQVERVGDGGGDGDAPAWQPEHDAIRAPKPAGGFVRS